MDFKFETMYDLLPELIEFNYKGHTFYCRELSADDYKAYATRSIKASQSKSSDELKNALTDMTTIALKGGLVNADRTPVFKNDKQVREFTSLFGAALVKQLEDIITEDRSVLEKKSSGEQSLTEANSTSE